MQLKFKEIEISNFMSFEHQLFDFSSMTGMNLIQGKNNDIPLSKNGTGKSNLGNSLLYAFFGQLQTKIKNENIVNRYSNDKDVRVVIYFDVDTAEYKIVRGIKNGKQSYLNLYSIENSSEVDLTKSTISETQEFLEQNILHCDITIFLRTILLTSDQTYNFYMLKKQDKKDFVEKLFDISIFGEMHSLIHKDLLQIQKDIIAQNNQLLVLNKNKEDYQLKSDQYSKQFKQKHEELVGKIDTAKDEKKRLDAKTVTINEDVVGKLSIKLSEIDSIIQKRLEEDNSIQKNINKLQIAEQKLKSICSTNNAMIQKHSDIIGKLCNDCQKIMKQHYNIDQYQSEIDSSMSKLAILEQKKKALASSQIECAKNVDENRKKKTLLKEKIDSITKDYALLQKEKSNADSILSALEFQLDQLDKQENPYCQLIEENKSSIDSIVDSISKNEKKNSYMKFAEGIVSQDTLRKFIIKDLVTILNNRIKTYLTKLGAKYYVEFNEDMDYEFITTNGSCEFGNFSAGERMRLMIATSFAFRDFMSIRNGLNANVLILDEYFDSAIDSLCVENIIKILKEYNHQMKQNIFVISHRSEVNLDEFDRLITVEKTNNISTIQI